MKIPKIYAHIFIYGLVIILLTNSCHKEEPFKSTPLPVFNSDKTYGTIKDVEGNVYKTIAIGQQVWMAENLRTTKFRDNVTILKVTDKIKWENLSTPAYCWYNNDEASFKRSYGALYNWDVVITEKLCPVGWHVPTNDEWHLLTDYLGGENIAGGKLKEIVTTHWASPNTGATNESGFTALPGGNRFCHGTFGDIGNYGAWWSASQCDAGSAWLWRMYFNGNNVFRDGGDNQTGLSVRCIKD